jgi:uncharacterized spore protein YtfJ
MDLREIIKRAHQAVSVSQVMGEPIERDGLTVVPAATVFGGGGGGGGGSTADEEGTSPGEGAGFGFGLAAWPAGAFEIRDQEVRWHPAIDYTRIALSLIFFAYLLLRSRRS